MRVDREEITALLESVASGERRVADAVARLSSGVFADGSGYADLGFAKVDTHRPLRTGEPEVVYGAGKTAEQIAAITARLRVARPEHPVLITKVAEEARTILRSRFDQFVDDPVAAIATVGPLPQLRPVTVAILCAGTSDLPVATEAAVTARAFGLGVTSISDVGVAGLHRLLAARETLDSADCVIVVAGMDGALPSAVGGMVSTPLIAVPTSVGYGASFDGLAPLLTMLNSCAPGVSVVNIDNGFGAAVCAARVLRLIGSEPASMAAQRLCHCRSSERAGWRAVATVSRVTCPVRRVKASAG